MSSPEPFNGNVSSSPAQRLVIAVGALIVITLTVVAAILLAVQPQASATATPVGPPQTVVAVLPMATFTSAPRPTDTPSVAPSPSPTSGPTEAPTNTPVPPPATNTPVPQPPTSTSTPMVIIVTPTPLPQTPPTPGPAPVETLGVCQPPPSWAAYTVQAGDTLNSLSARTGVSVYDLQQVNCLSTFTIQPGQVIYLPFNPPSPTATATTTPVTPSPTASVTPTNTPTPRPPEIFDWSVSLARDTITIRGRYFDPNSFGFRVELIGLSGTLPALELGQLRSSTSFEAKIPSTVPGGDYDMRVINPDGQFVQRRITLPAPP